MRVTIDTEQCTGHGRCYTVVPTLFEDDEGGHGQARYGGVIADGQVPDAERAVRACPEKAIAIVEP